MGKNTFKYCIILLLFLSCVTVFPLLGYVIQGKEIMHYLYFPPMTTPMAHAPFFPPLFWIGVAGGSMLFMGGVFYYVKISREGIEQKARFVGSFPWWGWIGAVLLLLWWGLAWSRLSWFSGLQSYTFFPLWLSFIVCINALCHWRTGSCPALANPQLFTLLFLVSAPFWWCFEYLNQFVGNWYYVGVDHNPVVYSLHATLSFSTVLPSFYSIYHLIEKKRACNGRTLETNLSPWFAWLSVAAGGLGLLCVGLWPEILFFSLWLAPLFILMGALIISGKGYLLINFWQEGTSLMASSLAALICGFFWEMWNYFSQAKWIYSIPFVHGYQIFEMPLLGYLGYLPFGVLCLLLCRLCQEFLVTTGHSKSVKC